MKRKILAAVINLVLLVPALAGCAGGTSTDTIPSTTTPVTSLTTTTTSSTTPAPTAQLNEYQLEYVLLATYPDYFWCDPDVYPVARSGAEQQNAIAQFPAIQANTEEFSTILQHLGLPVKSAYSDAEKLAIYREHKLLTDVIQMNIETVPYQFTLRIGQNQGYKIQGTVSITGQIKETSRVSSFNTCPICLAKGTLIDTPQGPVPVENVKAGMLVWTEDAAGQRVAEPVVKTSATPVPAGFSIVKLILSDGRSVSASAGHPTADFKAIGDYRVGDVLDGATVVNIESLAYDSGATYDLLPAGDTGFYRANGILLGSTLK